MQKPSPLLGAQRGKEWGLLDPLWPSAWLKSRWQEPDRKKSWRAGAAPHGTCLRALEMLAHCRGNGDTLGPGFLLARSHIRRCLSKTPRPTSAPSPQAEHCHLPSQILTSLWPNPREGPSAPAQLGDAKGTWGEGLGLRVGQILFPPPLGWGGEILRQSEVQSSDPPQVPWVKASAHSPAQAQGLPHCR